MKLNRAQLEVALSKVKPGLENGKEYQEQMKHVFFDGEDIATYNDHIAVLIPFEVDFKTSVRFEDLYKAVHDSLLNHEEIDIYMDKDQLIIESNDTKVGLATIDYEKIDDTLQGIKDQLPNDENGVEWLPVPEDFTTGLGLCVFAASTNMMLKGFTCVRITNEDLMASDNHRGSLFGFEKDAFNKEKFEFLIQAEDGKELVKFPVIEMCISDKWCHFITDDDIVFSTKLVGNEEFLNFSAVFKEAESATKLEFPVSLKDKIEKITSVHNYLDGLPQVGKVLSFSSIIDVATQLNNDKPLGTLEMGVLYSKIPKSIKTEIIDPYISIEDNEARISLRIIDSQENLRRNDLINKINFDLKNKLGLDESEFKLAGVLILFNNLLQSLFKSQILTLGLVMAGIFSMFIVLFKNIRLSLIGVIPNFIAAFFILGIIGLLGIPLDMMTITIAAITIGIAVDNSIHYIYRFKEEFNKIKDYNKTLKICHATVGVAILNTSLTIVFGFSILVLSKFIPTIYFGMFTGLAMLLAMISVLTLLPSLILVVKPFGK